MVNCLWWDILNNHHFTTTPSKISLPCLTISLKDNYKIDHWKGTLICSQWKKDLAYLWNSHSLLSSGQTCLVLSQREMQWKWKAWLHTPQATVHSSLVAEAWLAWHSIPASCTIHYTQWFYNKVSSIEVFCNNCPLSNRIVDLRKHACQVFSIHCQLTVDSELVEANFFYRWCLH